MKSGGICKAAARHHRDICGKADWKGADGVLREKEKQLSEERAARLDLEKQVQRQESNTARRRTELHYFFLS